jgi:hypothetical protein
MLNQVYSFSSLHYRKASHTRRISWTEQDKSPTKSILPGGYTFRGGLEGSGKDISGIVDTST